MTVDGESRRVILTRLGPNLAPPDKSVEDLRGKAVLLDLDWYGWSRFDFNRVFEKMPELLRSLTLVKMSRESICSFKRDPTVIRAVWDNDDRLLDAQYRGLKLWEICKVSIARELGYLPSTEFRTDELALVRQFYHWATLCINGVEAVLHDVKPYAVIVFQGGLFDSRIIAQCAIRRGIRCIAVETSFIGDHVFVDSFSGAIINRHMLAALGSTLYEARMLNLSLDPLSFWQNSLSKKIDHHRTSGSKPVDTRSIPANRKHVLILGQVSSDASVVMDSPTYRSPAELISHLVSISKAHADWHIIVRLHPKEALHSDTRCNPHGPGQYFWDNTLNELKRKGFEVGENITIISGRDIDTYELMKRADVGVTINSQAGLEMTILGRPVVTTGRCFYAGSGFTWDITRRELLETAVEAAIDHGLSEVERVRLRSFCQYLFGYFLLPLDYDALPTRIPRLREILGLYDLGRNTGIASNP